MPVLCKKCGSELPEHAKECLKCGQPRPRPRIGIWVLLLILIGMISWAALSDNPYAQEFRDDVSGVQTQTVVQAPFSVEPHSFSSYKLTVPSGAMGVTLTGQFAAVGISENNIEVSVLTDSAFAVWSNGYSTSNHYDSGRVPQGDINAALPSGAGIYYLVFNNKFSQRTPKAIHATVLLHYRSLIGEWIYRLRDWLGL